MDVAKKIKNIIEALLIVSESGLAKKELLDAIGEIDSKDLDKAIDELKEDYSGDNRAFMIMEVAGRLRIVTKPEYMPWINNLYKREPERLTTPSLETLAILAYKQPVTRSEIEIIRGVNVGGVLKTLVEKSLIEVRGRKDVPGKPLLYGTTRKFLELFGLNSLEDLPTIRDVSEDDLDYNKQDEPIAIEDEGAESVVSDSHAEHMSPQENEEEQYEEKEDVISSPETDRQN